MTDEQKALVARLRSNRPLPTLPHEAADMIEALTAEIARLRAKIAEVKARGVAMQNDAYTDGEKYIGWGWECAGEWLEELAQEAQETQP